MKNQIGLALRKSFSPRVYRKAITIWRERLYWQHSTMALFVRRRPIVQGYPDDQTELASQLRCINVLAPTPMCRAMHWQGSDKSLYRHNYTTVYNALFGNLRNRPLRIFEVGLGSTDAGVPFNMSSHGVPGASLHGWKCLFPSAQIFGADIDRKCLFQEDRIRTTYCDQLDKSAIRRMWSETDFQDDMDLIVDDGLHTFEANMTFLSESLGHLRSGGVYVVEDIGSDALDLWNDSLRSELPARFPNHQFALTRLPNPYNSKDNNMLIIRRPAMETQSA